MGISASQTVNGKLGDNSSPAFGQQERLTPWVLLIGAGVVSTTLAQAAVLRVPFENLLKAELHATREQTAAFFAIIGVAWYFKPLLGLIVDNVPLFGTRRRYYLLLGTIAATLLWLTIGFVPHTYSSILFITTAMETLLVFGSTVVGGLMVEVGQRNHASGRISSARNFFDQFSILLGGVMGGFLAERAFGWTVMSGTIVAFLAAPFAYFMLKEPRVARTNVESLRQAKVQLRSFVKSRTLWSAAGLLFLVYIVPGFSTPLYYFQVDTLKFSQQFIGVLASVGGACGMLGAGVYALLCRRWPLRKLLYFAIAINAAFTLLYLLYRSHIAALFIDGQNGFVFTLAELALMDLAVRATPKGSESLGFALMMSVRNIALIGISDVLGSWLVDKHHFTFYHLVWLNSGTTALVLFAIPFLPRVLTDSSDAASGPIDPAAVAPKTIPADAA